LHRLISEPYGIKSGDRIVVLDEFSEQEISEKPISPEIEEAILHLESSIEKVDYLLISNYIAVVLFLEGILRPGHFDKRIEDDNSLTVFDVQFLEVPFTLFIRDEQFIGRKCMRIIGKNGKSLNQ
jgi:hypothetical protein